VDAALNRLDRVGDLDDPARPFPGQRRGGRWRISCRGLVFLVGATGDDPDCIVGQGPLQHLGFVPWRAHPNVTLLVCGQETGMAFGWIGSTTAFGDVVRKP
jgi:hypothetical protein